MAQSIISPAVTRISAGETSYIRASQNRSVSHNIKFVIQQFRMGNTVAFVLRSLLPAEDSVVTLNKICRLGGRRTTKFPIPTVKDSNAAERGDVMEVPGVAGRVGGEEREEVSAVTGRFTVTPVLNNAPLSGLCNKLLDTAGVRPLKINNGTQTLATSDESFLQKHRTRILFYMSCICFTAATLTLIQFAIKSIISLI